MGRPKGSKNRRKVNHIACTSESSSHVSDNNLDPALLSSGGVPPSTLVNPLAAQHSELSNDTLVSFQRDHSHNSNHDDLPRSGTFTITLNGIWTTTRILHVLNKYEQKRKADQSFSDPDFLSSSIEEETCTHGKPRKQPRVALDIDNKQRYDDCICYVRRYYARYYSIIESDLCDIIHKFFDPDLPTHWNTLIKCNSAYAEFQKESLILKYLQKEFTLEKLYGYTGHQVSY
ncbi:hypothetical protein BDZ91DRAFT_727492 [Kalaharituber pfeilii]|nr:hypothetical protein BDZ91DRAFT_727492 [Kalaharituber pfeilii]